MNGHSLFSAVVIISAAVVSTAGLLQKNYLETSIVLSEPYEIVAKQGKSLYSNLGNVPYRNCGGAGKFIQWRTEACTSSLVEGVCLMPAEKQHRCELTFVPSGPTEYLSARTVVRDNEGEQITWQNPNISTSRPIHVEKEYSFKTAVGAGSNLRGKMLTVQLQFYRESDKVVEACTEGDFLIV